MFLQRRVFTIRPVLADQHKQIGIKGGATTFKMRTSFIGSGIKTFKIHRNERADQKNLKTHSCS
jgi:hypothetical protein